MSNHDSWFARNKVWIYYGILVVIALIAFYPSFQLPWSIVDDGYSLKIGKDIESVVQNGDSVLKVLLDPVYLSTGRIMPVSFLSWYPQYALFGDQVLGYRVLRFICLCLLLGLMFKICLQWTQNALIGLVMGLLFLFFAPILCNRASFDTLWSNWYRLGPMEPLQMILIFLIILVWWSYLKSDVTSKYRYLKPVICWFLFWLALWTKETSIVLIPIAGTMWLLSCYFESPQKKKWLSAFLSLLATILIYKGINILVGVAATSSGGYTSLYSFSWGNITHSLLWYGLFLCEGYQLLFILGILSFVIRLRKKGKLISDTDGCQSFCLVSFIWGLCIYLPWFYPAGRYMMLWIPFLAIFLSIELVENFKAVPVLRYQIWFRYGFITGGLLLVLNFPFSMSDYVKYYRGFMQNNHHVIQNLSFRIPSGKTIYLNLPPNHEFTYEIGKHLELFYQRTDLNLKDLSLDSVHSLHSGDYLLCYSNYSAYSESVLVSNLVKQGLERKLILQTVQENTSWRYPSVFTPFYNCIKIKNSKPLFYKKIYREEWMLYQLI